MLIPWIVIAVNIVMESTFVLTTAPALAAQAALITCRSCSFVIIYGLIIKHTLQPKAVEETEEAIINAEESDPEEDESADGMRLVRLLFGCAEAVACRDRSHASALLSQLRACALVFGSSFQRVASCFFQGLAERLSLVRPLGGGLGFATPPMMNKMHFSISDKKEEALSLVF